MFTGIIEEIGVIKSISQIGNTLRLNITARLIMNDLKVGDSIAVNGVCLTVTRFDRSSFFADVMPVTFYATNLAQLKGNHQVNLERAMAANGRFGGHVVSGHVDTIARIGSVKTDQNAVIYTIEIKPELAVFCISKGSIAIDGTSLTIIEVGVNKISVSLIPHTRKCSVLGFKKAGELVNIECDILAKQQLEINTGNSGLCRSGDSKITENYLAEHGFI